MLKHLVQIFGFHSKPKLLNVVTGDQENCSILPRRTAEGYEIELKAQRAETVMLVSSAEDFEGALQRLRVELEARGLLLLINRYRRNAFVSTMSRQMSDGLACYLVKMGRPVSHRRIVNSLAPAPAREVVTRREADEFIEQWIASCN